MGIPKYFRWLAERYPCILTPYQEQFFQPVDNLYLDMNGLIHPCTHSNDGEATRASPEKDVACAIFQYIDKLFQRVKPRKYFFMCVDGVAPRAKMNQQRQRRFRSADDAAKYREQAIERGQQVPHEDDTFDSNCITPGTEFMCKLSKHLKYFIEYKLQVDALWKNCTIIFSGQEVPGEGEHKIFEFIRNRKTHSDYAPNETHCLYGLDADLIMLALCSHEPYFILLREEIDFGKSKMEREKEEEYKLKGVQEDKQNFKKADRFQCLHICMLREYLVLEFGLQETSKDFHHLSADFERIVDDFVVLCYFVGNDFLPCLPLLDIRNDALEHLITIYKENFVEKKLYLTKEGQPNWQHMQTMFEELGKLEANMLKKDMEDKHDFQLMDPRQVYYQGKMGLADYRKDSEDLAKVKKKYLEGLIWNITYYFQGCPSWKWYYPYYYSPYAADLAIGTVELAKNVNFTLGDPFLPYQQLLAVLPPKSARLIPRCLRTLMLTADSPIADMYPEELIIDRDEKQLDWEGVVKIPFVDEDRLLKAYSTVAGKLNEQEKQNNKLGEAYVYRVGGQNCSHTVESSLEGMPDLIDVLVERIPVSKFNKLKPFIEGGKPRKFQPRLVKGTMLHAQGIEGFPTFATIPGITAKLQMVGANVFGMASRKNSLVISIPDVPVPKDVSEYLGREVLVGFPYQRRGCCVAIATPEKASGMLYPDDGRMHEWHNITSEEEKGEFKRESEYHSFMIRSRLALDVGPVSTLVYVKWLLGITRDRFGHNTALWSDPFAAYPFQLINLEGKSIPDQRYSRLLDNEPPRNVLCLRDPHYGCVCDLGKRVDRDMYECLVYASDIKLAVPPGVASFAKAEDWMSLGEIVDIMKIQPKICSMLLGSFSIKMGPADLKDMSITDSRDLRIDIGLGLKFNKRNLGRLGYARKFQRRGQARRQWLQADMGYYLNLTSKKERDNPQQSSLFQAPDTVFVSSGVAQVSNRKSQEDWMFSPLAINLLKRFVERFPQMVHALANCDTPINPSFLCTGENNSKTPEECVMEIQQWLNDQDHMKAPLVDGSEPCLPIDLIRELESTLSKSPPYTAVPTGLKLLRSELYIPYVLTNPNERNGSSFFVPTSVPFAHRANMSIACRVVYAMANGAVPLGSAGTVTRVCQDGTHVEVVFDNESVTCTKLNGRLLTNRGAMLDIRTLIVIWPRRKEDKLVLTPSAEETRQLSAAHEVSKKLSLLNISGTVNVSASTTPVTTPSAGSNSPVSLQGKNIVSSLQQLALKNNRGTAAAVNGVSTPTPASVSTPSAPVQVPTPTAKPVTSPTPQQQGKAWEEGSAWPSKGSASSMPPHSGGIAQSYWQCRKGSWYDETNQRMPSSEPANEYAQIFLQSVRDRMIQYAGTKKKK